MIFDDLELRIYREFREISQIWQATTAERMKIDPYCERRYGSPLNVLLAV